jgi:uncharacterized protein (TIGR03546 family)
MFSAIVKLFKSLNANSHPGEIAHAVCLGVLLGLMPKNNALWYIFMVFILFLRINKGALILFTALFTLIAPVFDTHLDTIGYTILMFPKAVPVYRMLLDIPFVAFTKFNNTVVMGSIALSLAAYIPLYVLARLFIKLWRTLIIPGIVNSAVYKGFMKLPFISKIAGIATRINEERL